MTGAQVDWSTVDWFDADADDPRSSVAGFRDWRFYAQPVYARQNGVSHVPREFRAPTAASAKKVIERSPSGIGHIVVWNDVTGRDVEMVVSR